MTLPRQRLRLPRSRRLRRSAEFRRARSEGHRLVRGCLVLNWLPQPDRATSCLGVVTAKAVGRAVDRARARRLLREAFRQVQHAIHPPSDVVLVARASIRGKQAAEVRRQLEGALRTARLLSRQP